MKIGQSALIVNGISVGFFVGCLQTLKKLHSDKLDISRSGNGKLHAGADILVKYLYFLLNPGASHAEVAKMLNEHKSWTGQDIERLIHAATVVLSPWLIDK